MEMQQWLLTSFHRGYKRNAALFPRLFCRQESHSILREAEVILQRKTVRKSLNLPAPYSKQMWVGWGVGDEEGYKYKVAGHVFHQLEILRASLKVPAPLFW